MVAVRRRAGRSWPQARRAKRLCTCKASIASREELPPAAQPLPLHLTPNPYSMYRFNRIARFTL